MDGWCCITHPPSLQTFCYEYLMIAINEALDENANRLPEAKGIYYTSFHLLLTECFVNLIHKMQFVVFVDL